MVTNVSQWRYVPSAESPADIVSRGISVKQLGEQTMWWVGPPLNGLTSDELSVDLYKGYDFGPTAEGLVEKNNAKTSLCSVTMAMSWRQRNMLSPDWKINQETFKF